MMTLNELKSRVSLEWVGYGQYRVWTIHRGQRYTCISNNTLATDRIKSDDWVPERAVKGYYTLRGAYQALHYEVLIKNGLT